MKIACSIAVGDFMNMSSTAVIEIMKQDWWRYKGGSTIIPNTYTRIHPAFHPGLANVKPIKPSCADQTRSIRAQSIILDFFILLFVQFPLGFNQVWNFLFFFFRWFLNELVLDHEYLC